MTFEEIKSVAGSHGVATPVSGALVDSPACLHCGKAIPRPRNGQRACSGRCRWALWKAGRESAAQARDRKIREYLLTAEESLQAIRGLLRDGP
jgi:predicted nucleic acid-binding Zn ribbon protein